MLLPVSLGVTLAALLFACGGNPRTSTVAEASMEVPAPAQLALITRVPPVVEARVNGRDVVRLMIDTGADLSLLGRKRANALGLSERPYSAAGSIRTADGGVVPYTHYVHIERLEIGSLALEGARLPVIDSEVLAVSDCDGIVGQDLLSRLVLVLDVERGGLHLLPPGSDQAGIQSYLQDQHLGAGAWLRVPVQMRPSPFLTIEVPEGSDVDLEIDTGASTTSLPRVVIDRLHLEPVGTSTARSLSGETQNDTFHLRQFGLFGLVIDAEIQANPLAYGLLGLDIVGNLVVVLDGPKRELWLHRRKPSSAPSTEER